MNTRPPPPPLHRLQLTIIIPCFPCPASGCRTYYQTLQAVNEHLENSPACIRMCDSLLEAFHNNFLEIPYGAVRVASNRMYFCTLCSCLYRYNGLIVHLFTEHSRAYSPRRFQLGYFTDYILDDIGHLAPIQEDNFQLQNVPQQITPQAANASSQT